MIANIATLDYRAHIVGPASFLTTGSKPLSEQGIVRATPARSHILCALCAGAPAMAWLAWTLVGEGRAPGDIGDGRFNAYVLEHGYQFLAGQISSFDSPSFFYPYKRILFVSDTHVGSLAFYALFRLLGASNLNSFVGWFLLGYAMTFVAAYYALARMGFTRVGCVAGAFVFAFNLPSLAQFTHAQLAYRGAAPLALLYFWLALERGSPRFAIAAVIWLCVQTLLSVYLGVFLTLLLTCFGLAYFLSGARPATDIRRQWRAFAASRRRSDWGLILALIAAMAATLALLANYAAVKGLYGVNNRWGDISIMVPRWRSYLLQGALPYWSDASAWLGRRVRMAHEHQMFLGFGVLGFALAGIFALFGAAMATPKRRLAISSALGLALLILLTMHYGPFSPYRAISLLPGVSAVRAVSRVILLMALPVAILAALGAESLLQALRPRIVARALAAALAAGVAFEAGTQRLITFSIAEADARASAMAKQARAKAQGRQNPILMAVSAGELGYVTHLDAMVAAQRLHWPTLNGYSGYGVPGGESEPSCALPLRQLSAYDNWRALHPAYSPIDMNATLHRIVFVGRPDCEAFSSTPYWKAPGPAEALAAADAPALTLSRVGFDQSGGDIAFAVNIHNGLDKPVWSQGGAPLRLSWRFVDAADPAPDGPWRPREEVWSDIPPRGDAIVKVFTTAPSKPGDYRIEISLVSEGRFWLHELGMAALRLPDAVHGM